MQRWKSLVTHRQNRYFLFNPISYTRKPIESWPNLDRAVDKSIKLLQANEPVFLGVFASQTTRIAKWWKSRARATRKNGKLLMASRKLHLWKWKKRNPKRSATKRMPGAIRARKHMLTKIVMQSSTFATSHCQVFDFFSFILQQHCLNTMLPTEIF